MHGHNVGIPPEVRLIESDDVTNAVSPHGRDQAGIMDFYTLYLVDYYQPTPLPVNRVIIRQERKGILEFARVQVGLFDLDSEAVILNRARRGIPELGHILDRVIQRHAALTKSFNDSAHEQVCRVVAFCKAKQNIAIDEVGYWRGCQS